MKLLAPVLLCLCLFGCSESIKECSPGESVACVCTDSNSGAQVCREDGSGWKECICQSHLDAATTVDTWPPADTGAIQDASGDDIWTPADAGNIRDASGDDTRTAADTGNIQDAAGDDTWTPPDAGNMQDVSGDDTWLMADAGNVRDTALGDDATTLDAGPALDTGVAGNIFYVSEDGDDTGTGRSENDAWATLYKASISISPGDMILLRRGDSWAVTMNKREDADGFQEGAGLWIRIDNITIDAYGTGDKPIIDATANTGLGEKRAIQAYAPVEIGEYGGHQASDITVRNLDLRGAHLGPAIYAYATVGRVSVSNCDIMGAGWESREGEDGEALMIAGAGSGTFILEDNLFDQITGNPGGYSKAVEIRGGGGHVIAGNIFYGFGAGGAVRISHDWAGDNFIDNNYFYHPDTRGTNADAIVGRNAAGSSNTGYLYIRNNVFDLTNNGTLTGNNLIGCLFYFLQSPNHYRIYNNTFVGAGAGYGIKGDGTTMEVYNNIFHSVGRAHDNAESNVVHRNNIIYNCGSKYDNIPSVVENETTDDPHLADPTMSNHQPSDAELTANSSAAIDNGYGVVGADNIPAADYNGTVRDNIDIGAFEF